ncbi:hypothetical protein [Solimonas terrae]|uniref:Uncharacterized protein n=1 Tax=Solimonas terrae TaxID=1396819 RepID=A0A6M2BVV8_9GAMM|nr:hypothetical protein [Solimonas terrae]NGY06273.1 hypothetical protein [Solimonas terrae]
MNLRALSLAYMAGLVAALISSVALWAAARFGVLAQLHVAIAPVLSLYWLCPRLVVGGLWGLQLLLPTTRQPLLRGIVISLAPTLFLLLWIFPFRAGQGWLGMELGLLTPVVIWAGNLLWGWTAVLWSRATGL